MEKRVGSSRLVGLELLPGRPQGGVLIRRVLEFNDAQRQAVDKQHHVGPAGVLILGDCELVDRQPVVAGGFVEVDNLNLRPANGAVAHPVLHRHALHQHPVKGAVSSLQRGSLRSDQLAKGILQRVGGQVRVQSGQGIAQPLGQHYLAVFGPLRTRRIGSDVRSVSHLPADIHQPLEGDLLDVGFGEGGHSPVSLMKGIGRWELRSGASRFVPRGMFSTSHCPRGLRGRVFSAHTAAGTTTKGRRTPICCGPSSSASRSTSDRRALASATVQMRIGVGLFRVILLARRKWSTVDYNRPLPAGRGFQGIGSSEGGHGSNAVAERTQRFAVMRLRSFGVLPPGMPTSGVHPWVDV